MTPRRAWPLLLLCAACRGKPAPPPAATLHEQLLTLDTHLDTPALLASPDWDIMQRHSYEQDLSQVDYPRMVEGGLDGGFFAIYTPQGPRTAAGDAQARSYALQRLLRIREMVARNHDSFALALRADDAARIASEHKRVVFLSMENAYPLEHDLSSLQDFYALGVRMVGPVHFSNNDFGDSSTDPKGKEWGGLSPLGKQLVAEANRLGIILDGSHASDDVLDQMLALSTAPIILSHSSCKAVFDHPRNVDDERLRKLASKGGVIQINSMSEYLIATPDNPARKRAFEALWQRYHGLRNADSATRKAYARERLALEEQYPEPRASFADFMRQLRHALQVVGPEHVGIGADWDGGGGVTGMQDVSDLPKITAQLTAAGYSRADLANIWGGNVLRVMRAVEARAAHSP